MLACRLRIVLTVACGGTRTVHEWRRHRVAVRWHATGGFGLVPARAFAHRWGAHWRNASAPPILQADITPGGAEEARWPRQP